MQAAEYLLQLPGSCTSVGSNREGRVRRKVGDWRAAQLAQAGRADRHRSQQYRRRSRGSDCFKPAQLTMQCSDICFTSNHVIDILSIVERSY